MDQKLINIIEMIHNLFADKDAKIHALEKENALLKSRLEEIEMICKEDKNG
jgi:hypothetical protein